jgi:hypothetical protein
MQEKLIQQKQGELYSKWIELLRKKSRIVENESVLSYEAGAGREQYQPDDY